MCSVIDPPLLSIVTINFNGYKDTCELIDSIKRHIYSVSYEIIVVDNASRQQEGELIKSNYPWVSVICSTVNLGFSGGNNLGIKQANGEYIFLLNNDTYVCNDHFDVLIKLLKENDRIGIVSPKIRFAAQPQLIQYAGFTSLSHITLRNKAIGYAEVDNGQFDSMYQTGYAHGAALLIKKTVIEKIGLMPEIFFLYYEELDWCTKALENNYEIWYSGSATIYHKESQSTGEASPLKIYYMTRNRLLYAWRHKEGLSKWVSLLYLITVVSLRDSLKFLLSGKYHLIKATWEGIVDFIKLPHKLS
ncbi:glycosyltransferase family 2 protein [uncultured Bacteroides sp.]|uniref:glycosyltransferase family 2 protein n=1 Tax=uncultured Bacteroides sp. TaxID=162156 RepID=UPI00280AAD35|nr:glycosyltransferase family 2 protein [uncultured Bacteroides sp.]